MLLGKLSLAILLTSSSLVPMAHAHSVPEWDGALDSTDFAQISAELAEVAARKPVEFEATAKAVEPYLVESTTGGMTLDVPAEVAAELDAESLAVLTSSVTRFSTVMQSPEQTRIIKPIIEFVKRFWKPIVEGAKKSGKWAWHKAPLCAIGAQQALSKAYGTDMAWMMSDPKAAIAVAVVGCVKNL